MLKWVLQFRVCLKLTQMIWYQFPNYSGNWRIFCVKTERKPMSTTCAINIVNFRTRDQDILPYFTQEHDLVYWNNIFGLLYLMGLQYIGLKIDSSSKIIKQLEMCVAAKCTQISFDTMKFKEQYQNIKTVLEEISFVQHQWSVCINLNKWLSLHHCSLRVRQSGKNTTLS